MSFYSEVREALFSPDGESLVAEGLAEGCLHVVNRHSVSPGGLRWLPKSSNPEDEIQGCWILGTGFVSFRDD